MKDLGVENKEKAMKKNVFREGSEVSGEKVKGYDFEEGRDYEKIIGSFANSGFQATQLAKGIEIANKMIKEKVFVYLGYTSNMISSGNREVIKFLVKEKKVNVLVTTTGGIEEDIIKCLGDFVIGDFEADGKQLRDSGINRIGNIFAPNNRYVAFEEFVQPILKELYEEQMRSGKAITGNELIWKLGEKIGNEESVYYWAWKNGIPIYCPVLFDGALGDNIYFFSFKNSDFKIDSVGDMKWFNDTSIGLEKSGALIVGSGVVKHSILNANMLRNGAEYIVYINNSQEFDGSDAGARPDEAVSWGKIKDGAESVKIFGDATIILPILVAESFARN